MPELEGLLITIRYEAQSKGRISDMGVWLWWQVLDAAEEIDWEGWRRRAAGHQPDRLPMTRTPRTQPPPPQRSWPPQRPPLPGSATPLRPLPKRAALAAEKAVAAEEAAAAEAADDLVGEEREKRSAEARIAAALGAAAVAAAEGGEEPVLAKEGAAGESGPSGMGAERRGAAGEGAAAQPAEREEAAVVAELLAEKAVRAAEEGGDTAPAEEPTVLERPNAAAVQPADTGEALPTGEEPALTAEKTVKASAVLPELR